MKKAINNFAMVTLFAASGAAYAAGSGNHDHGSHDHGAMEQPAAMDHSTMDHGSMDHSTMDHSSMGGSSKMFLEKKDIDGYTVSFHVMAATDGMNHGGSHNLMLKVEKGGSVIGDLKMNSKVVFPDGSNASKAPMKMGDWFTAGYDMNKAGKYQLMVLFKTADGQKHFGGLNYTVE